MDPQCSRSHWHWHTRMIFPFDKNHSAIQVFWVSLEKDPVWLQTRVPMEQSHALTAVWQSSTSTPITHKYCVSYFSRHSKA
eukprot:scaffold11259_cov46-Attheya_sp.AAC.1